MKVLKKILKVLGIALLSFVALIVVFLFGIKIWNHIAMNSMPLPDVPTIQYVSGVNKDDEMWVDSHDNIVNASSNGKYVQLECGHNVYEYESVRIAEDIKSFLGE